MLPTLDKLETHFLKKKPKFKEPKLCSKKVDQETSVAAQIRSSQLTQNKAAKISVSTSGPHSSTHSFYILKLKKIMLNLIG